MESAEGLKRLLDEGWIVRVDDPEPDGTDRERKAYSLTDQGRYILRAEVDRLHKLVSVAKIRVVRA